MKQFAIDFLKELITQLAFLALAIWLVKLWLGEDWIVSAVLVLLVIGFTRPLEEALRRAWRNSKEQSNG